MPTKLPKSVETQAKGKVVGKSPAASAHSRDIHATIVNRPGGKGQKRSLKRPVHQGASKSTQYLNPPMSGSRGFSFGSLPR